MGGAAVAKAGVGAIIASGWIKPILFIVLSPLLGMALGLGLTVALSWAAPQAERPDRWTSSSGGCSWSPPRSTR